MSFGNEFKCTRRGSAISISLFSARLTNRNLSKNRQNSHQRRRRRHLHRHQNGKKAKKLPRFPASILAGRYKSVGKNWRCAPYITRLIARETLDQSNAGAKHWTLEQSAIKRNIIARSRNITMQRGLMMTFPVDNSRLINWNPRQYGTPAAQVCSFLKLNLIIKIKLILFNSCLINWNPCQYIGPPAAQVCLCTF